MHRLRLKLLFGGVIFLSAMLFPVLSVEALTIENSDKGKSVTITNDVEDDLFVSGGGFVDIDGDVNGDLFAFGGNVNVRGNIEGNVYASGGVVTLESLIGKSVYVAGGTVYVNGEVYRDVFVAGGIVYVNGNVGEDVLVAAGTVNIEGEVTDDVRVAAGSVRVTNRVGGDIVSASDNTHIQGEVGGSVISTGKVNLQDAVVAGDLVIYGSERNAVIDSGSSVQGDKIVKPHESIKYSMNWNFPSISESILPGLWVKTFWSLFQCVGLVMVGYLLFKFAPIRLDNTLSKMNDFEELLKSTVVGFLAFPVGLMIGLVLLVSVFGWPLLKVFVLLAMLATSLTTPIAGIWLGRKVLPFLGSKRRYVIALALGVVIIQIVRVVPVFGWLFYQLLVFAVIGAMLRMQWSKYQVAQNLNIKMSQ